MSAVDELRRIEQQITVLNRNRTALLRKCGVFAQRAKLLKEIVDVGDDLHTVVSLSADFRDVQEPECQVKLQFASRPTIILRCAPGAKPDCGACFGKDLDGDTLDRLHSWLRDMATHENDEWYVPE